MSMSFLDFKTAANALLTEFKPLFANSENKREVYFDFIKKFNDLREAVINSQNLSDSDRIIFDRYSDKINSDALNLSKK